MKHFWIDDVVAEEEEVEEEEEEEEEEERSVFMVNFGFPLSYLTAPIHGLPDLDT